MLRLKRIPLIVVLVGLAAFACSQDLNQKVTYETVAVSVRRAISEIASKTKTPLDTSPAVANEIVVIDVKDVTVNELMERLALATSCKWQKMDGVYLLVRPNDVTKAEEQAEQALKLEAIKKTIKKLLEPINKVPVLDAKVADELAAGQKSARLSDLTSGDVVETAETMKSMFSQGSDLPAGRATAKLLSKIDLSVLAKMKLDDRVVFSSRPNRMQIGMGQGAIAILNQFVLEQNIWADAYKRRSSSNPKTDDFNIGSPFGLNMNNNRVEGTPDKALLCVEYDSTMDSYSVEIKIYDNKGKMLYQGGQPILMESSMLNAIDSMLKPEPTKDPEIELSKDSAELLAFWRGLASSMMGATKIKDLSKELYAKLSKPDQFDMLSFIHSEALIAIAKARGEQLVADVPDSMMSASSFAIPGQKLTANGFMKQLLQMKVVAIMEEGGWMVIKSARPSLDRAKRCNRVALGKLIAASNAKGYLALDDIAGYAMNNGPITESEIAQVYALVMIPGAAMMSQGQSDWNMLRFYGSLTLGQRQALGRGEAIRFGNLIFNQIEYVRKMAYQANQFGSGISITGGDNGEAQPSFAGEDYRSEPTELLPNGLPRDGSVSVKIKHDTVVQDAGPNQPRIQLFGSMGPDELATMKMMKDDPTMGSMLSGFLPEMKSFRVGDRMTYDFVFKLTPEATINRTLMDNAFNPNSPILDLNGLPDTFKKRYNELQEQMKKVGGFGDIFGGSNPPAKP
jgi:hypothetical protein